METLNEILTLFREVKDKKEAINKTLKDLNAEEANLQDLIIQRMREEGLDKTSIKGIGTASIGTESYPQIKDMEAFIAWTFTHGKTYCLRADSLKAAPYREMIEAGEEPDGVEAFDKTKLSFRRA